MDTVNVEFIGILCRHILKVFCRLDIDEIPNHYILPRWKQEANKFQKIDGVELMKIENSENLMQWYLDFYANNHLSLLV